MLPPILPRWATTTLVLLGRLAVTTAQTTQDDPTDDATSETPLWEISLAAGSGGLALLLFVYAAVLYNRERQSRVIGVEEAPPPRTGRRNRMPTPAEQRAMVAPAATKPVLNKPAVGPPTKKPAPAGGAPPKKTPAPPTKPSASIVSNLAAKASVIVDKGPRKTSESRRSVTPTVRSRAVIDPTPSSKSPAPKRSSLFAAKAPPPPPPPRSRSAPPSRVIVRPSGRV